MKQNKTAEFIKNPKKSFYKLALPMFVALIVQTLYNITDTAFVGRLGAESIAALTFAFPFFFVFIAVNAGINIGMGSKISRLLGKKKKIEAENTAMHGLFMSLLAALIIFIISIFSLRTIFSMFGAEGVVLELAVSYMTIILLGIFLMFPAFTFGTIFSSQGDTTTPMKIQIIALVTNIILDPIFIYVLGYGVKGAAIATVIAFSVGVMIGLYYIIKKSYLKIHISSFKFSFDIIKDILYVGVPASLTTLMIAVYIMIMNKFMAYYGTDYIAAMGIATRLESVAIMPIMAAGMALVTLVGMFHGAKKYKLMKEIIWYGTKVTAFATAIIGIVTFAIPELLLRIFTPDSNLINIGIGYLRINVFTYPLMAIIVLISRSIQGMGYGMPALFIYALRFFILVIPFAYVFVYVMKLSYLSIALAMVLGAVVASIVAIVWLNVKVGECENNC